MKKYLISAALVSVLAGGQAMAVCPYTLDATATQISQITQTLSPPSKFPSVNLGTQRVSGSLSASPAIATVLVAGSATGIQKFLDYQTNPSGTALGDHTLPSSGIVVAEYRFNNFAAQLTGSEYQYLNSGFEFSASNGDNANPKNMGVSVALTNYNSLSPAKQTTELLVMVYDRVTNSILTWNTYPVSQPVANTFRVGLYVNQDSKQIGLNLNGINKGYIATLNDAISHAAFMPAATSQLTSTSGVIGQSVSGTLITDASQMTLTYPSGAKDICGNTI